MTLEQIEAVKTAFMNWEEITIIANGVRIETVPRAMNVTSTGGGCVEIDLNLVESAPRASSTAKIEPPKQPDEDDKKECTCAINDLMNNGCQCGAC
jgi:hypothetical protein